MLSCLINCFPRKLPARIKQNEIYIHFVILRNLYLGAILKFFSAFNWANGPDIWERV